MSYNPNCLHCRRDAGKDAAGVTQLCEAHKDAEIARLEHELAGQRDGEAQEIVILRHKLDNALEKLAEREATVDILVSRVHERDAELGRLKRTGKTERGFTNDYIKALHAAESRLSAATALLRETQWCVQYVSVTHHTRRYQAEAVALLASLRAFLAGEGE